MYTPYTNGYAKWLISSLLHLSGVLLVTFIVQTAKILKIKGLIPYFNNKASAMQCTLVWDMLRIIL